jgi:hypothetical protein
MINFNRATNRRHEAGNSKIGKQSLLEVGILFNFLYISGNLPGRFSETKRSLVFVPLKAIRSNVL